MAYKQKEIKQHGLSTIWPPFIKEKPPPDIWYVNLDGLTVGKAYTAYDARQLQRRLPGSVIVEPLEVVNRKALALIRALARWEEQEL